MEDVLRTHGEALQYTAFFGIFISFGLVELWRGAKPAHRAHRWRANLTLTVLCILMIGALPVTALMAADYAATRNAGLLNTPALPASAAIAAGVLLRSLLSYLIHVAFHKSPWLWRLHAVHHTDTDMDVTTAVRMHPLEFAVSAALVLPCIIAFGIPVVAILIYEIFDAGMAAFAHTKVRLPRPLDRVLRSVIVTPALHRIHHSSWQPETDSNFGATFSFWDRMFGTYRHPEAAAPSARLGLDGVPPEQSHKLGWLLALPVGGLPPDTHPNGLIEQDAS